MRVRFRDIREQMGKSQTEFAVMADVSISRVSGFESGRVLTLTPRLRRKLATAYGVPIADIDAACGITPVDNRVADTLSAA